MYIRSRIHDFRGFIQSLLIYLYKAMTPAHIRYKLFVLFIWTFVCTIEWFDFGIFQKEFSILLPDFSRLRWEKEAFATSCWPKITLRAVKCDRFFQNNRKMPSQAKKYWNFRDFGHFRNSELIKIKSKKYSSYRVLYANRFDESLSYLQGFFWNSSVRFA